MRNLFKHFLKKIFGLFLFAFILISCQNDEEIEGSCKFHVISYGDGVVGWYIIDNDDPVTFSVSEMKDSSYSFSVNFATPESSIYIFAKAASDSTESISIMLYDNGELLQSKSAYKVVDEILINEVSYTDFVSDTE
ncbi:MAG TPA: hypothetical protein PLJ39_15905 [Spirochaetota bacterium]|nr:hypothetical protein [Spirochaetota bacterium]